MKQSGRTAIVELLILNRLKFKICNPQLGKYAGRVVAGVSVKNAKVRWTLMYANSLACLWLSDVSASPSFAV